MLAVGGNDGNIRLLDPRLRSTAVEHLLTAHTGPVQALAVTPTDGLKVCSFFPPLVTCTTRLAALSRGFRSHLCYRLSSPRLALYVRAHPLFALSTTTTLIVRI